MANQKNFGKSGDYSTFPSQKFQLLHFSENMKGWSYKIICKKIPSKKTGLHPLYLSCHTNGVKNEMALGIHVPFELWDDKSQNLRQKKGYADTILLINQKLAQINSIEIEYRLRGEMLTFKKLEQKISGRDSRMDFITYMDQSIRHRVKIKKLEESTSKVHLSILNKMSLFNPNWFFADIDTAFIEKFHIWHLKYLKEYSKVIGKKQRNNGHNTACSALKTIKTYLRLAMDEEYLYKLPKIKIEWLPTTRESLTEAELQRFIQAYHSELFLEDESLHYALELFLFACSTGMRLTEIRNFSQEKDIKNDIISLTPQKTKRYKNEANIPLNILSRTIIGNRTGRLFEKHTDQFIREKIKLLAAYLGVHKVVNPNTARHTFVTLWLEKQGNIYALKDIVGHKNISTTMNYQHKNLDHLTEEMQAISGKLFEKYEPKAHSSPGPTPSD